MVLVSDESVVLLETQAALKTEGAELGGEL